MKKVLVIAPHPDDEVLGCGGTIIKHVQKGDEVYLCIVTKAYTPDWTESFINSRKGEIEKSNKVLGIKKTFFLDFLTAKLDNVLQKELNQSLDKIIKKVNPEIIYIPHQGDLHNDHRMVFLSSLVVTRPGCNNSIKKLLSYEVLSETDWGNIIYPFLPNLYIDVSDVIDKKIKAMEAYSSEVKKYPHPRSLEMIKILAQRRGAESNVNFAEAFLLIREIN